jgi:hypothetical protein
MSELPPDARALGRVDPATLQAAGLDIDLAPFDADVPADDAYDALDPDDAAPGEHADDAGEHAGVVAERERLARQLRETRMQLALTQARLTALQNSATMALGKTLVNAAKRPWPRGAQLPRDLFRMWRDRGAPGKSGGANLATALASAQLNDLKGTGGRFLSAVTAPGAVTLADPALLAAGRGAEPPRLVITGALTPLACATLAPDAVVHPLLPHDADILIDGTGADLVIIEAAALLAGSAWAYATDPAAADRGRRLARMIVMARSLGKPVVLVRNVPPTLLPGLGWVASACDAVWDGGLGVQLARFNPVGVSMGRAAEPLYASDRDPREAPAVRALLDQLTAATPGTGAARVTGARSWRSLPELYRGNAVFLTASASQAREQLACGARVVGPVGSGADAAAIASQLATASDAVPLTPAETLQTLREIFSEHATPVALAGLIKAAGLPATPAGGRQVAALAVTEGTAQAAAPQMAAAEVAAAQAATLTATLLRQRLRPAEVIVGTPPAYAGAVRDALAPLQAAGILVRLTEAPPGLAGTRALARQASSPWVAPLAADAPLPDTYLLDLACARECAQADAVGFSAGSAAGTGEFEVAQQLAAPALARRELFLAGSPAPEAWGGRGLRLFTISRGEG